VVPFCLPRELPRAEQISNRFAQFVRPAISPLTGARDGPAGPDGLPLGTSRAASGRGFGLKSQPQENPPTAMRTAYIVVVLAASARAFFAPAAGALMARRSPAAASSSARQRWPALQAAVPPSTGAVSKNGLDIRAMVALPTLTATQFVTIAGLFRLIDTYAPAALLSSRAATPAVWSAFLFLAVKSRVFSLLDNSRPQREGEAAAKAERRRPTWTPPPLAFPIIWSTIGLLRASSATVVWRATGRKLCSWPLLALVVRERGRCRRCYYYYYYYYYCARVLALLLRLLVLCCAYNPPANAATTTTTN
jgi:tryptophan-rich sensory protein